MNQDLIAAIEQIHADTVLIVVHAGTKSFSSPEKIEYVREQLEQFRLTIGKPIMCLHPDLSIESLNDEQLKKIGLQRIKD